MRRRVFGDDDPRTLTAEDCRAAAHRLHGSTDEAICLAEAVAADRARVLGPTHLDALASRLGLGLAYASAGVVEQAVTVLTAALQDAESTCGGVHRHTIELRAALACCQAVEGDPAAAAEYERVVADAVELLGAEHPDTAALRDERDQLSTAPPS